jgi:hypothetical protein
MRGAIPPLSQYASMAWCSVKEKSTVTTLTYLTLPYLTLPCMGVKRGNLNLRNAHTLQLLESNVKLCLCFKWAPRHEGVLGEWRYSSTHSLALALDGGYWSASRPGRFTSREKVPATQWIGDWVGPRAGLNTAVKRKIPSPRRESNPWSGK